MPIKSVLQYLLQRKLQRTKSRELAQKSKLDDPACHGDLGTKTNTNQSMKGSKYANTSLPPFQFSQRSPFGTFKLSVSAEGDVAANQGGKYEDPLINLIIWKEDQLSDEVWSLCSDASSTSSLWLD